MSAPPPRPVVSSAVDEDARSTLSLLLADTVAKAVFTAKHPESAPSLRADEYRQLGLFERNTPEHSRPFSLPRYRVQSDSNLDALSNYLRTVFAPKEYFDADQQQINFVSPYTSGLHLTALCSKLVTGATIHGPEIVADVLCSFLEEDSFPLTEVHVLLGSRVDTPIRLDDWAEIQPYSYVLRLLSAKHWPGAIPLSRDPDTVACALVLQTTVRPQRECKPEQLARMVHYSGLAKVRPDALVSLMTVACQRPLQRHATTSFTEQYVVDTLPVSTDDPHCGWRLLDLGTSTMPAESIVSVLNRDDLATLVDSYSRLDPSTVQRFRIPLSRFGSALSRRDYQDRCIDLAIAFESLLVDTPGQITTKLTTRSAWLYAENDEERTWTRERMKAFYRHRSEIVHGESVGENEELMCDAVSVFVVCFRNLLTLGRMPLWKSEDLQNTLSDARLDELDTLSAKHDSTSWTVRQERTIDEALSAAWKATLPDDTGGDHREAASSLRTHDIDKSVRELQSKNVPHVVVTPQLLEQAHPFWTSDTGADTARTRHCDNDVDVHIFWWWEEAERRGTTIVCHIDTEERRVRGLYSESGRLRRAGERCGVPTAGLLPQASEGKAVVSEQKPVTER